MLTYVGNGEILESHAITSAALKLLLLLRTGLTPGRVSALEAGTTTVFAPVVIHASDAGVPFFTVVAAATSVRDGVFFCGFLDGTRVGSREGVGEGAFALRAMGTGFGT